MLSEVRRVLRPGGYLGLDTPNARVTRLQQDEFIDPDHEHEYTDAEMRAKLTAAGFEVDGAWGLNHAGPSLAPAGSMPTRWPRHAGCSTRSRTVTCWPTCAGCRADRPVPGDEPRPAERCGREDSNLHPLAGTGT